MGANSCVNRKACLVHCLLLIKTNKYLCNMVKRLLFTSEKRLFAIFCTVHLH